MSNRAGGFTLLELLVVIVVLALVMSIVLVRWSGVHHKAVMESAVDRLESVDQHLRHFARSRGRGCRLVIDLRHGRFRKLYGEKAEEGPAAELFGPGMRIATARLGGEKLTSHTIEIAFDRTGKSPTYAMQVIGPGTQVTWLVFAGVSGQMTRLETERQWNETLDLAAPERL